MSSVRPLTGWPDMTSLDSHKTRRAANSATIAVIPRPNTILMSVCVVTEGLPNAYVSENPFDLQLAHSDIHAGLNARKAALTCRSPTRLACGSVRRSQHGAQHGQHLRPRTRAQSAADAGNVMLDRFRRDEQLSADIAVGHAQQQQFGDFAFAVGQP